MKIQLFRAGGEVGPTRGNRTMRGVPVDSVQVVHWKKRGWGSVRVHLRYWPSGLYFARIQAGPRLFLRPSS